MRQRDKVGRKAKAHRRKAPRQRPNTPKTTRQRSSLAAATNVARLTRERDEALAQQTATADVLKVISRSTFDLQMVLSTLVESACRLCDAEGASIWRPEGDAFKLAANFGHSAAHLAAMRQLSIRPGRETCTGRVLLEGRTVHIPNRAADPEYQAGGTVTAGGNRAMLGVPLLREGSPIGVFTLIRTTARPFTEKQIELATTFADQAVIAIENVRLFEAEQQRSRELSESLEQQTATSEVLKVISSSPGELEPVFNAMLENATRICEAKFGALYRYDGKEFHLGALLGAPPALTEFQRQRGAFKPPPGTPLERLLRTKEVIRTADNSAEEIPSPSARLAGAKSHIAVPMFKDDELAGAIVIYRQEVRPFTEKQIELVQNFAAQAVIAIENARLLNELRKRTDDLSESLEQQTATSEVLQIISSSQGDLEPVFNTMLGNATRICEAKFGVLFLYEGDAFRVMALHGAPPAYAEERRRDPRIGIPQGTALARIVETRQTVQVADIQSEPVYSNDPQRRAGIIGSAGARTLIMVPMLKDEELIGAIAIFRQEVRPFTNKQIELVTNFAAQAVIAIENARLLTELRQRTTDLTKSLEELRTTQDRLVQTQKLALLGQLTAGIAHEIKNPLNFVNNFSGISAELIGELQDTLKGMPLDDKARTEINDLTDTLKSNFDKVVHHGRRADAIVKNMLQHSREGLGEHRVIDINALVEESLNLAWHGARAETQGFEVKLKQSFDPSAGGADVFPQIRPLFLI